MNEIPIPATRKLPLNLRFASMAPGRIHSRFVTVVTAADLDRWGRIYDDHWSGPFAPPDILYYVSQNVIAAAPEIDQAAPSAGGGGLARYRAELLAPIPVDVSLEVSAEITDRYVRRGRGYLEWRTETSAGGRIVQRDWKTWVVGLSPTEAGEYPERPSEPRSSDERPPLDLIGPRALPITIERLAEFEGPDHPNDTTHTNLALARAAGFPNVRAQGAIPFGLVARLMIDRFGDRFLGGGTLDIRLLQAIYAGETLSAYAEIVSETAGQVVCRVRAQNPAGQLIAAGLASVPG